MSELLNNISSLALFRGVRNSEPLKSLCVYLRKCEEKAPVDELVESYGDFVSILYSLRADANLSEAVWDLLVDDSNPFLKNKIDSIISTDEIALSEILKDAAIKELELLNQLGTVTCEMLTKELNCGYVPVFGNYQVDFKSRYLDMIENIEKVGYGIYSKYRTFKYSAGKIVPIKNPDPISVDDLFCYEMQREKVVSNTKAFLSGKPAADILLYGDAGTGKSSTVKAVSKSFINEGLRLVELPKSEISNLPDVIEKLSAIPMKFILYVDDLSFEANDERIGSLKSVLEGAASGGRKNIIIYITSNRRHMIKETFSDRSDEIHASDTIAEQMSLSERFGLRILFDKPNKFDFLKIVRELAKTRGIEMDQDELDMLAERFALRSGGRSARLARQFIDSLNC
ncbi:MAG: ATP-binding protein [Clostridia bacterium]|nr:ATP-binding protein [Clostridia bacterium]